MPTNKVKIQQYLDSISRPIPFIVLDPDTNLPLEGQDLSDSIDLSNMGLTNADGRAIFAEFAKNRARAVRIKSLNLEGNHLSELADLGVFPNLVTLLLQNNHFIIGPDLTPCPNLRIVNMLGNTMDLPPQGLETLQQLFGLSLSLPSTAAGMAAIEVFIAGVRARQGDAQTPFMLRAFQSVLGPNRYGTASKETFERDFSVSKYRAENNTEFDFHGYKDKLSTAYACLLKASGLQPDNIRRVLEFLYVPIKPELAVKKRNQLLCTLLAKRSPAFDAFQQTYPALMQEAFTPAKHAATCNTIFASVANEAGKLQKTFKVKPFTPLATAQLATAPAQLAVVAQAVPAAQADTTATKTRARWHRPNLGKYLRHFIAM